MGVRGELVPAMTDTMEEKEYRVEDGTKKREEEEEEEEYFDKRETTTTAITTSKTKDSTTTTTIFLDFSSIFDIDFLTEEDKDELLKNTKLQMRHCGVGHGGYNQSIIKSALQKGVRRNQHNLVAWCLRETFLFYAIRNRFPERNRISAKQFNTNIINRLYTIAVEDCSPRAIIATNECARNLKLYSNKEGCGGGGSGNDGIVGDPKYLMRAGFCLSTCPPSRVCSHLRYLCGGEGEIFIELDKREREKEEEEEGGGGGGGKNKKISIPQRLQIIFNVLVNKIKPIDDDINNNDYSQDKNNNNNNNNNRNNHLQLLLRCRRVICAYHTLKIYHQLANMDDCGNSLLIGQNNNNDNSSNNNKNQGQTEQEQEVEEEGKEAAAARDEKKTTSYQSLLEMKKMEEKCFSNNNNNVCVTTLSKKEKKKNRNCGSASVADNNNNNNNNNNIIIIKPPTGARKKVLFSPFWEMCKKVMIKYFRSEANRGDNIDRRYRLEMFYALEWRKEFFTSRNYFKEENLLLLSTIELLIAIIHGPTLEFASIQRGAWSLQQNFDKSLSKRKEKNFNWLLNHKPIDSMPDYVMDQHTFSPKRSTSFALEGSLVVNGDRNWTPDDWRLAYTRARLIKEIEKEKIPRNPAYVETKKNNNINWSLFDTAKLSVQREAIKVYRNYYNATASVVVAAAATAPAAAALSPPHLFFPPPHPPPAQESSSLYFSFYPPSTTLSLSNKSSSSLSSPPSPSPLSSTIMISVPSSSSTNTTTHHHYHPSASSSSTTSSSSLLVSSSFMDKNIKCKKRKRLKDDDYYYNNNDEEGEIIKNATTTAAAKAKRIKYVNKNCCKKINDSGDFIKKNFSTLPKIKLQDVDRVVGVFNNTSKKPFVAVLKMMIPPPPPPPPPLPSSSLYNNNNNNDSSSPFLNHSSSPSSFPSSSLIVIKHVKQSLGYGAHQSFVQNLKDERICGFKYLHPLPYSGKYRGLMTGRFDIAPTANPFEAKIVEISQERPCNIYFVTGCVTQNGGKVCDTRLSRCRSSNSRKNKTIIYNKQNFLELVDIIAFRMLLGVNDTNHSNILVGEGGRLYSVDENKVGSMTSEMTMETVKFQFLEKNLRQYNKNKENEYCGPDLIGSHLPASLFIDDQRRKMMDDIRAIGQKYGISKEVLDRVETNSQTTGPLLMQLFSTF